MRTLIALSFVIAAALMTTPRAQAATWCYESEHGFTCGFVSLQQCLDSLWGNATGTCQPDPLTPTREIVRTQPKKRSAAPAAN
jgi:hypothetical protein